MATRKKYGATKEDLKQRKEENEKLMNKSNTTKASKNNQKLLIILPKNGTKEIIEKLKKILDKCESGTTHIFLLHNDQKMKTTYTIDYNSNSQDKIIELVGKENVLLGK